MCQVTVPPLFQPQNTGGHQLLKILNFRAVENVRHLFAENNTFKSTPF